MMELTTRTACPETDTFIVDYLRFAFTETEWMPEVEPAYFQNCVRKKDVWDTIEYFCHEQGIQGYTSTLSTSRKVWVRHLPNPHLRKLTDQLFQESGLPGQASSFYKDFYRLKPNYETNTQCYSAWSLNRKLHLLASLLHD